MKIATYNIWNSENGMPYRSEYIVDENAPNGLDYGMTTDEVIKADRLKKYTWEVENEVLRSEKTIKNHFAEVKELDYVKRYFFDSDGELASVRYELRMGTEYEEMIRQLLFDQATA